MEDGKFSLSRVENPTWTHIRVSGAEEWHSADPSPPADAAVQGKGNGNDKGKDKKVGDDGGDRERLNGVGSEIEEGPASPTNGGRNLFRMTDLLADKAFAFAPTGTLSAPQLSSMGDLRLQRRAVSEGSKDDIGGGGACSDEDSGRGSRGLDSVSKEAQVRRHASLSSSLRGNESPIPGILRRRLDVEMEHGLSPAEFAVRREGKLLLVMVGLPARGKTYIAYSIKRHMDWFGLKAEIFNAGNYRRKVSQGRHAPASLFDPANQEGAKLRRECAEMALNDALNTLACKDKGVYIAIFDATNTTRKRREWVRQKVERHAGRVKLVCVETVLTDDKKVWENVKEAKLNSPDYKGMAPEEIMKDFFKRIEAYKSVYEPCDQREGLPFIRLTNAGEEVLGYKTQGFLCSRILQLMDSFRLSLKPILLTRCGESEFETQGRIGGDSRLTPVGHLYAKALARGILQGKKRFGIMPVVWTSTRLRARQTVKGLRSAVSSAANSANEDLFAGIALTGDDSEEEAERGNNPDEMRRSGDGAPHLLPALLPTPSPAAGPAIGDLDVLEVSALDEIDSGALEGTLVEDFAKIYPELYLKRSRDKLNVKFPDGENYRDVFARLESLLLELVAEPQPVVIVAHLAVLRVIYGYLKGVEPADCPHLKIPMHCVLQLNPKGYGYEEWRHYPLMNAEDDDRSP
ncbi:unnamed protein product [Ascophyllum nodosum]